MAQIGRISTKKLIEEIIKRRANCALCENAKEGQNNVNSIYPVPCHTCRWSVYYQVDNNFKGIE